MKRLHLEARAVAWDEKPVSDLVAQQLNPADRREFAPELWISGVGALRKDKPDSIVPRRFLVIAEHNHDAVAYVHAKTGKHPANFGLQRHERFQHKRVRCPLSWLGGTTHDTDHNRLGAGCPLKPLLVRLEWFRTQSLSPSQIVQISGIQTPDREEAPLTSAPPEGEAVPAPNTPAETPPRD